MSFINKILNKISLKFRLIFFVIITLIILSSCWFFVVISIVKNDMIKNAENETQIMADLTLSIHKYFTDELKPHFFEKIDTGELQNDFDPIWMSSSYVIDKIKKNFTYINKNGYEYKHSSIDARNPDREATPEEKEFIIAMNNNPGLKEKTFFKKEKGITYYYFYKKGEIIEEVCLKCHGLPEDSPPGLVKIYGDKRAFNKKINEVVSVEIYKIPLNKALQSQKLIIILFLLLFIVFFIIKIFSIIFILDLWFFNPLKIIKDKMINISSNAKNLKTSINTNYGPELDDIIISFNKMTSLLFDLYNNQENVIKERTKELENTNADLQNLFIESNHRIKNNLSMLINMITLNIRNTKSDELKNVLKDIESKILTVSLIHDKLYKQTDINKINFKEYLNDLIDIIIIIYETEGRNIQVIKNIDSMDIPFKFISKIALIITELIINAFKYGLDEKKNILKIDFVEKGEYLILAVENNAKIKPDISVFDKEKSMGFKLIRLFAEVLKGEIIINTDNNIIITIKILKSLCN